MHSSRKDGGDINRTESELSLNILFARKVKHKTKEMSLLQDCRAVEIRKKILRASSWKFIQEN